MFGLLYTNTETDDAVRKPERRCGERMGDSWWHVRHVLLVRGHILVDQRRQEIVEDDFLQRQDYLAPLGLLLHCLCFPVVDASWI